MIKLSIVNPAILSGHIRHIAFHGKAFEIVNNMLKDDFIQYLDFTEWDWIEFGGVLFIIEVAEQGVKLKCNGN